MPCPRAKNKKEAFMNYTIHAKLSGYICCERLEPVAKTLVRLYRTRSAKEATIAATADPKQTFRPISATEVKQKASRLIAEVETDAYGKATIDMSEKNYQGGPIEIDIYCKSVPGQDPEKANPPRQFSITTIQPAWRQTDNGYIAAWDHQIHKRHWCLIRSLLGAWVICGRVVRCDTQEPVGGVRVFGFDRDWLQDDALGSDVTDGNGYFRIDYSKPDFTPGTVLDIELYGGPDVYFHVKTLSDAPLLIEDPSRGRDPGRNNIGPCFCVNLCVDKDVPQVIDPLPVFTHVGAYHFPTEIHSALGASGLTVADGRAFFRNIRLNGVLPKRLNGNPMEYQFRVREIDAGGTPISGWNPIPMTQIADTKIGLLEKWAPAFPGDPNPIKTQDYMVKNGAAGPNEIKANVVGGWIQVPQENDVLGPSGYFQPNGNMIQLDTHTLSAFTHVDLTGLQTGNSSTSTGQPLVANRLFSIEMRVREVGNVGIGVLAGICDNIAVNNTLYDNILRHPAWMPQNLSNRLAVVMVDIDQLTTNGCDEIMDQLDVLFTAAHPTLGQVSITMSGPGGPYSFTLPAAPAPGDHYGTATPNFVVADLVPCSYVVDMSVQVLLTDGDHIPVNRWDHIAFTKA
jgi:hypothetical protein